MSSLFWLQVRTSAVACLQRSLLVHDLQTLTGPEWESCFKQVNSSKCVDVQKLNLICSPLSFTGFISIAV